MLNIYDRIIKYSIYLLVFLIPLWFLPFSFEQFEFNKQYLLCFLSSIAFFAWLSKMILVNQEIKFRKTSLDLPILVFVATAILSTIFSVDKYSSILGFYGRFSDGLVSLISCVMLYFLITNHVNSKQQAASIKQESIIKIFLFSSFLVVLMSYLSLFGIWGRINNYLSVINDNLGLPDMMLGPGFNPVAKSSEGLAVFLAIIVTLLVTLVSSGKHQVSSHILLLGATGLMLIIDFGGAWLVLGTSLGIFVGFALRQRWFKQDVRKLLLPIFLITIAGIFLLISPFRVNLPKEQILGQSSSWVIGFKTLIDNPKNFFVGSGIGTFFHDFVKEKPLGLNQTQLWQLRYDRGGNHIAEIIATMGLFGLLSYLLLIGAFLLISSIKYQVLSEEKGKKDLPLWIVFVALLVGQLVYYQNTILQFMFWLILGVLMATWEKGIKEKTFSFKNFPEFNLIISVGLGLVGLVLVASFYYGSKFYYADFVFAQAEEQVISRERTKTIEKAVRFNPNLSHYRIILTRAYLNEILVQTNQSLTEEESMFLQKKISNTVDAAKKATELSPNSVVAWETLGIVYREIRAMAGGALDWGVKAFQEAVQLDPINPVLHTELGKLYLSLGNNQEAKKEFEKAQESKPDYVDALIQISLLYEKEEKVNDAIENLEELATSYPLNIDVLFQLGRLYYNNNQVEEAISKLEKAVRLVPNHSNTLYSLAIAYNANGEKSKAISTFERVLELNPGNLEIEEKLKELRK